MVQKALRILVALCRAAMSAGGCPRVESNLNVCIHCPHVCILRAYVTSCLMSLHCAEDTSTPVYLQFSPGRCPLHSKQA